MNTGPLNNKIDESYREVKAIDHLKSYLREFKILGVYLKILKTYTLALISGSDPKAKIERLKNKIRHIRLKDARLTYRQAYKTHLLVSSRNIMQSSIFSDSKMLDDLNEQTKAKFLDVKSNVQEGVCAGGCMDMAEQLLNKKNEFSSADVISVATSFKKGLGVMAVANQFLYSKGIRENELDVTESSTTLMPEERKFINLCAKAITLRDQTALSSIQKHLKEVYVKDSEFKDKYPDIKLFISLILPLKDLKAGGAKSLIDKYQEIEGGGNLVEWLLPIIKRNSDFINKNWEYKKSLHATVEPKIFSKAHEIIAIFKRKLNINSKKTASSLSLENKITRLFRMVDNSAHNIQALNSVAEKRNLKLERQASSRGLQSDEEYLEQLASSEKGVYWINLRTKNGAHATLFINSGEDKFFWDPNIGLLELDKDNPKLLILDILNRYSVREELEEGNHALYLSTVKPLKSA